MSLFKENSFLGVDIGNSSVKLVELAADKMGAKLLTYGLIVTESNVARDSSQSQQVLVASAIKEIAKKSKAHSKKVVSALPGFAIFGAMIDVPKMTEKELSQAIKYEAKRYIPVSLENMVLDWKVVGEENVSTKQGMGGTNMKVLLTAAPKSLVNRYVNIFGETGLSLTGLETEAFALSRSLVGNDNSPVLIVDIGAIASNIVIVENQVPVLSRAVDVGGKAVTNAIAQNLNISNDRAEQFKKDFGIKEGNDQMPKIIKNSLSRVIVEIKNSLQLFAGKNSKKVEKMILSGGSSLVPGLEDYLSKEVGIKVFRGNPWARISYPEALGPTLADLGPHFSVAVGLAMRNIGNKQ